MGLTTSALQIGRSALLSYQAALQVVGNNIANAGNAGYTRQSANLSALPPPYGNLGLPIGNGVAITAIQRNINEAIEARLRQARADFASAQSADSLVARIESIVNALGDSNLGTQMEAFFKSIGDLQNTPQSIASRRLVLTSGAQFTQAIRRTYGELSAARDDANRQIEQVVVQADRLAAQIAELNVQITAAEAASRPISAIRDQRDEALRQLSDIVGVTVREQPNGATNVYIGSEPLVLFGSSLGLTTTREAGPNGRLNAVVRIAQNNDPVTLATGTLAGLVAARDGQIDLQLDRLNQLAAAVIHEVNKLHSGGQGLNGYSGLVSGNAVSDSTAALSAAGLAFAPKTGTFYIDVKNNATGAVTRTAIHVDLDGIGSDTSLNSLAAEINAGAANLTAAVLPDGTLKLDAASGFSFTFGDDSSGLLASLGMNSFFAGTDATNIAVAAAIANSPELIAASSSGLPGDGSNAGKLAALLETGLALLGGSSLGQFYASSVNIHAVGAAAARSGVEAADTILSSLVAQRESVSGVNLDEEAIKLMTYQRSYEGAARYLTVIDEMIRTLLAMVG